MAKTSSITRHAHGKGFRYLQGEIPIFDQVEIKRLKALAIPPAWQDVRIAANPNAKVLAKGKDAAGRIQAIYHPDFRAQQERRKYTKILGFAEQLPNLRRQVDKDLRRPELDKNKVLACIVKLIDEAYFRVGNERYAHDNHSYGVTTLRSKHLDISGYTVTFDFQGKSGKRQVKQLTDRRLSQIMRQLDEQPGYELFRYADETGQLHNVTAEQVNEYIKAHMGEEYSAKDFRTWGGTLVAVSLLAQGEAPTSANARKKSVSTCVRQVAQRLGNTPAIARSSYIDPEVFERYMGGSDFAHVRTTIAAMRPQKYLSAEERCVLEILKP